MISAIVGDVVGSRHESSGNRNPDVALLNVQNTFTDDTVCTLAVGQWLLGTGGEGSPGPRLREYTLDHRERGFGPHFLHWATHPELGEQHSFSNGAAMRVSPVAFWSETDAEAQRLARASLHPTHLHPHAEEGAWATAWAIRHAFAHRDPERLLKDASQRFSYGDLTGRDPVAERRAHEFDVSAQGTVPLALVVAARGGSYEGALRLALSMGGDADTLAAIAGPIAEGLYGLDLELAEHCLRKMEFWFDHRFNEILACFYDHPRVRAFHAQHGREVPPVAAWIQAGPLF